MTSEEGRDMVVAEGAMMDVGDRDEATETRDEEEARGRKHASRYIDDARPKGRVLRAWETIRKGDLTELYGPWAPDDGFTGVGVDPERVGRFIRPEPETQAQPNPGTATQPAPTPAPDGATPIVDLVIADLRARAEVGLRTYGTLLHAHNGRRPDIDAYQEDLDALVYRRQVIEEIDDARRVLGASEGETLLAVAERVVARQNRYSDELGEVMDALGRHDDESTADAAKRRMGERATLHDERDEARRRLTSTEADLAAARARITYLEQHLAGAQRDAREQRTRADKAERRAPVTVDPTQDKPPFVPCADCTAPSIHPVCHPCLVARLAKAEERARRAEAQAPSGEAKAKRCWCQWEAGDSPCPTHGMDEPEQAPSGEPAPVEASEPEAIAALRAWDRLPPGLDCIDDVDRIEARAVNAIPGALRLYDAARAEVAALTARLGEERRAHRRSLGERDTWAALAHKAGAARDAWFSAGKRALADAQARVEMARAERDTAIGLPCLRCGDGAEPVAVETPDVVEAHHGRYRIRRIDSAA